MITTPDSWIERRDEDRYPPMTDREMCEEGICDHSHCEECFAIMSPDYLAIHGQSSTYICDLCWWKVMAASQLTYRDKFRAAAMC